MTSILFSITVLKIFFSSGQWLEDHIQLRDLKKVISLCSLKKLLISWPSLFFNILVNRLTDSLTNSMAVYEADSMIKNDAISFSGWFM